MARNLTRLSAVDKYKAEMEDATIRRILDLHDEIMEMGGGYWVSISAVRVSKTEAKPHGIDYSLCLLDPNGNRIICYDNAHPVTTGRPPSAKTSKTNDHLHKGKSVRPYEYTNAEKLLEDFWSDVFGVLKKEGIP